MSRFQKRLLATCLILTASAVVCYRAVLPRLHINSSLSVEGTLFFELPGAVPLQRGVYVKHCLPAELAGPMVEAVPETARCGNGGVGLVKRLAALPGDPLDSDDRFVRLPGQTLLLVPEIPRRLLPATVPEGEVFLAGETVRSFDSRYFGPVPITHIHRLWRIF